MTDFCNASTDNLKLSFTVNKTPDEVYEAINNLRRWWTGCIVGKTKNLNDTWFFSYPNIHFSKIKVSQQIPGKRVVWQVLDSYIEFVDDKEEWTGTEIVFEITSEDNLTKLTFAHIGLAPNIACYNVCRDAWSFYINDSLYNYIVTGKGDPGESIKIAEES